MKIFDSIKMSIDFIEDNLHNDIGVLDVANHVSYSQFYFSREFSRHTHISVYDYIIRRKLSEAYKQLFISEPKIVELAFRYGFKSHEVFSRAFRKLFGENPSEVKLYKPLAVFEAIDEYYLHFLREIKVERLNINLPEVFFEVNEALEHNQEHTLLLLSEDHLLDKSGTFSGRLHEVKPSNLSFQLCNLTHKLRIHHDNLRLSHRYFTDYIYDSTEMNSNYILCIKENNYIDYYIPTKISK